MGIYFFSNKKPVTGNVIQDGENKLPGRDSLGSYVCESGTLLYLPFDLTIDDESKSSVKSESKSLILYDGKFSNASYFKPNSSLDIPIDSIENAITLSLWVKTEEKNAQILALLSDNNSLISVFYRNGLFINYLGKLVATSRLNKDWQNLVITINPKENRLKVFLDGSFIGWGHVNKENISLHSLYLGGSNFTGQIDDLIIYNTILDDKQILAIYNDGAGKPACISIPECIDSDLGINQNEKGIIFTKSESKEDYCLLEGDKLRYVDEYYCLGNKIASKVMDCPQNCFNGACIQ